MPHHKLCPRNPPFSTDSSWKMYKFCLFALISNLYNPRFESKCSVTLIFSGTIVWIIYYNVKETNIYEFEQHPLERMISQSSKAEKEKNAQYCSDSRICIIIIKWNRSASGIEKCVRILLHVQLLQCLSNITLDVLWTDWYTHDQCGFWKEVKREGNCNCQSSW